MAQGRSLSTYQPKQYFKMISEIMDILNNSPSPSEVSNWDKAGGGQGGAARCLRPTGLTALSPSAPTGNLGPK